MDSKEFVEELLTRLYDLDYRTVEFTSDLAIISKNGVNTENGGFSEEICVPSELLEGSEVYDDFNIADYLGFVDWENLAVDTPVLVKNSVNEAWNRRYFAYLKDDTVYTWGNGSTSWTCETETNVVPWFIAKVAEIEK